jgi:hypothetical protein
MTDLTEQWKKGEQPNGYYWIRLSWGGMVIMAYHTAFDGLFELDDHYYDSNEISEVLAPVPSYDEWFKIKNLASLTSLLQEKNIECLHRENKLKELLKQSRIYVKIETEDYDDRTVSKADKEEAKKLLTKIDEVLK